MSGTPRVELVPGAFRDPQTRLAKTDEAMIRLVDADTLATWRSLVELGIAGTLTEDGLLVPTQFGGGVAEISRLGHITDGVAAEIESKRWHGWLRHELVTPISYPCEWTFTMRRDAALLLLELVRRLVRAGFILKDGTLGNMQWYDGRPVLVDIGSIEPYDGGPWTGYRQFCAEALFPLVLEAWRGIAPNALLRGAHRGIEPRDMRRLLRTRDLGRRGVLAHIVLQAWSDGRTTAGTTGEELRQAGFTSHQLLAVVRSLERMIRRLRQPPNTGTWNSYRGDRPARVDQAAKSAFVEQVLAGRTFECVLDLGANDGAYARVAARHSRRVIAVDADHTVLEEAYRSLRDEGYTRITPMLVDLLDPTGPSGWRHRDRMAWTDRCRADMTLCLALVHHLVLGGSIPVCEVVDLLEELAPEVVLEVPHADDPAVVALASRKTRVHPYGKRQVEAALARRFDIVRTEMLPSGTRTIYHLRCRT